LQARDVNLLPIEAADLVVTLGYDMVEYHPRLWNPHASKRIVHIDFLPAEVDHHYRVDVEVVGDLAHTLWMLNERAASTRPLPKWDTSAQRAARRAMNQEFFAHRDDDTRGSVRPQKAIWDARAAMGAHDILLSDVGAHKMWIARYYQCDEPNTCLIPNGFCSMGFALPGAIAAKLVHPERKVLAICGDGGFLMNVQEMETARRLGTNLVAMVWEDRSYGLIAWKQDNQFGRHVSLSFDNPDWVKLAESFGWAGFRVDRSAELQGALQKAFAADRPALIAVAIDYGENALLSQRLGKLVQPL
jgi:acetolactate synthase-1/2/3 large subunit